MPVTKGRFQRTGLFYNNQHRDIRVTVWHLFVKMLEYLRGTHSSQDHPLLSLPTTAGPNLTHLLAMMNGGITQRLASPYRERTNLRTVLVAIVLLAAGISALAIAHYMDSKMHPILVPLLGDLGALLIASVPLSVVLDLFVKRALIEEIFEQASFVQNMREAGILKIGLDYIHDVQWRELFETSKNIDIFFSYANTWRGANVQFLRSASHRPGTNIRFVLPDPESEQVMQELARRFSKTSNDVVRLIQQAEEELRSIFSAGTLSNFSLWYSSEPPLFTMYRFDGVLVLALYKHTRERGGVPVFISRENALLYKFAMADFDAFVAADGALARKVYSN
jgi:hypothetical protein